MTPPFKYPALSPSLTVRGADKAIAFYTTAFGAKELYRLIDPASGVIGHAELLINGGHLMLAEENPAWGNQSPEALGGTAVTLSIMVEDTDATLARATAAGATVECPATDMFYGFRCAAVRDPFGHRWLIQHKIEDVSPEEMQKRWAEMPPPGETKQ